MKLGEIQDQLRRYQIDGWLFFDHHERDPLAYRVLGFSPPRLVTRRWYYWIPATGDPLGLVHRIESGMLAKLPGDRIRYSSWQEQVDGLRRLLTGSRRIAMQYSPDCKIPYVSMVDAGTLDLVRQTGVEVVSSGELIQYFEARLDADGLASHLEAGRRVDLIRAGTFRFIGEQLKAGTRIDELAVKRFILEQFAREGLFTDHGPIVGVNANAANPHYEPDSTHSGPIVKGDFVLMDMWAKLDVADAVYYDITWTGYCGANPPSAIENVFDIVTGARNRAIGRVKKAVAAGETLRGFEVDDAAREYIESKGFGADFPHRTGHSIGRDVHGNGANMDNLETHDDRKLIPWTCFSIEPGIYLDTFGIRSEINMFIDDTTARVTGEMQDRLVAIE
ncbi:MAG: aminopeptidase P family protein [Acidobacteriota bacterium]|nr:aminopeptidase P family protein [Acidobacteriota bacterium]